MSSRYFVLWFQFYRYDRYRFSGEELDICRTITREDISAFEVEQTLDERSSSLCDMLFCLSEDNSLEDLLSVDNRVHYAEILNASSVRGDYVSHDSRGEERSAFVFYTIKCIIFFAVLFWEVSATLCRKSSVELTLQKTITPNTSDSSPKSLDGWSSSQINRTTYFWRSIGVIRSLVLRHVAHTLSDNSIMIE